jgi:tetratricopeptide (TPR) repeat protein
MGKKPKSKNGREFNRRPESTPGGTKTTNGVPFAIAVVALLALTVAVYAPVAHYGFVSMDDPFFVEGRMKDGLTIENIQWAFSGFHFGFYGPVGLVSHMADREIFGDWAGGHHLTNLLLHLANTLLLLAFLARSTGARWRSLFVAALFALHPLHVEAVAWVAERKELLCALFEILALLAYIRYARAPRFWSYAPVWGLFAIALLSKTMAITFPFLLLLVDYWPLGRLDFDGGVKGGVSTLGRLVMEKVPLFALIPFAAWATVAAQAAAEAFGPGGRLPLADRLANAGLAYGWYPLKMLAPTRLAAYYPHTQGRYSLALLSLSLALLAAATAAALWLGRRHRYVPVGWFWYAGTLVPVIGIVQVGLQAWADRYTYIPLVGLFIIISWGAHDALLRGAPRRTLALASSACLCALALAAVAQAQVRTWRSTETLNRHILRYYPQCPIALINLGNELGKQERCAEAVGFYEQAARLTSLPPAPKMDWAFCLSQLGREEEAVARFRSALADDPSAGKAYFQLAFCLSKLQRHAEAIPNYRKAFEMKAVPAAALTKIGDAYRTSGLPKEASEVYRIVLAEDPTNRAAREGLATCAGAD